MSSIEDRWRDDSRYRPVRTPRRAVSVPPTDMTPEELARALMRVPARPDEDADQPEQPA